MSFSRSVGVIMAAMTIVQHAPESHTCSPQYPCACAGVRPPSAQQAHDLLVSALQDQAGWESRAQSAKELLNHMMKSRRDAALLGQTYDIKCASICCAACHAFTFFATSPCRGLCITCSVLGRPACSSPLDRT